MADNNQNQNQAPYQVPYQPQQTIIVVGQDKKSPVLAFFLTFFFGPLGLFYASITGGIVMLILDVFVAFFTFGIGLLFTNIICVIWALTAVSKYNKKNSNPHQFQQFQQPQQQTNAYQTPSQQQTNPIIQSSPTQQFSNTPPVEQQFTQTNVGNQTQNDIGETVSNVLNSFAEWVTKNKKALLIGVGFVIGLTVLLTVVRTISSMRFIKTTIGLLGSTQAKTIEPAPIVTSPPVSATPVTATPIISTLDTAITAITPPAIPVPTKPIPKVTPSATTNSIGYVQTEKGSDLRLRTLPKIDSEIIATIPNKTAIIILGYEESYSVVNGENGKWCQINYDGKVGWVWGNYVVKNSEK